MRLRKFLRKFHRWIGILASLWLLLLASTGLLLQHSDDWHLNKKYIQSPFILEAYGIGKQFIAFNQDGHQLIQLDKQIIQDNQATIKLSQPIKSAIYSQAQWIVATDNQIYWLNKQGQLIQSMDDLDGIPIPITALGQKDQHIFISSKNQIFLLPSLKVSEVLSKDIQWKQGISDAKLKISTLQQYNSNYLSYEQAIFNIHAGITAPGIFNDFAAIALIILSLSGIFLFFKKRKTNRQAH
jgi:hypothetical protein